MTPRAKRAKHRHWPYFVFGTLGSSDWMAWCERCGAIRRRKENRWTLPTQIREVVKSRRKR